LFQAGSVLAQDTTAGNFQLNEISARGVTLDKGWKFHAGDNSEWARHNFNDASWTPIDPTDEIHHLQGLKRSGIGWFRLRMQVDSHLLDKTFAFAVSIFGAAEIYLNGQLIYQFGMVSADFKKEKTRYITNQVLKLHLGNQSAQTIAVRYSFNKKNIYLKFSFARPIVQLRIKDINQAFEDRIKTDNFDSTLRSIEVSFYLPLGFLLLFLFFSFRQRREYLFSGIFSICMFAAVFLHIFAMSEPITVTHSNLLLLITNIFYVIGCIALIEGLNILFKWKRSWFFIFIAAYGILSLFYFFISYDVSPLANAIFFPLINFEFLRLTLKAVSQKKKGAWILLITSISLTLSFFLMVWFMIKNNTDAQALLQSISYIFSGIGLSLFYAGEFARTGTSLRLRVIEVEKLSLEKIASEREKQQILGAQNETLEKQVAERTAALSQSLKELKEAEEQLIQREKMASLGELTAGIAHEIQNPLNFVNNFSDVNTELIDEMKTEMEEGNISGAIAIARDIKENEQKINHHGKRADSIVKGMLLHSRNSTGLKELTDINVLVDECMRLSYHGMRAKDKAFNAKTVTDFDTRMQKINIVSQDIGRVILNLFTNAFYSVMQKKNDLHDTYSPIVSVATSKEGNLVKIIIRDNGNGISQKVIDKIFQPFFTTKPTGEGTGLGLSMSYDIITKGHSGELKVNSKEGEFAEFIIILPV
jgi:signal transduction histidine kinase